MWRPPASSACLLEVSAPKPGNVSPERHFHDTRYEDFLASAVAIGPRPRRGRRSTRWARPSARAVEATRRWTRSNTNLGIVLLLAPLARAALQAGGTLRAAAEQVLAETTVADAEQVYAAIRHARPGRAGRSRGGGCVRTRRPSRCGKRWPWRPIETRLPGNTSPTSHSLSRSGFRPFGQAGRRGSGGPMPQSRRTSHCWPRPPTLTSRASWGWQRPRPYPAAPGRSRAAGGTRSAAGLKALAALDAELRDPTESAESRHHRRPHLRRDIRRYT